MRILARRRFARRFDCIRDAALAAAAVGERVSERVDGGGGGGGGGGDVERRCRAASSNSENARTHISSLNNGERARVRGGGRKFLRRRRSRILAPLRVDAAASTAASLILTSGSRAST